MTEQVAPTAVNILLGYGPLGILCLGMGLGLRTMFYKGLEVLKGITEAVNDLSLLVGMSMVERLTDNERAKMIVENIQEKIKHAKKDAG